MPTPTPTPFDTASYRLWRHQREGIEPPDRFWDELRKQIVLLSKRTQTTPSSSDLHEDVASEVVAELFANSVSPYDPDRGRLSTYLYQLIRSARKKVARDGADPYPGCRVDLEPDDHGRDEVDDLDRVLLVRRLLGIAKQRCGAAYAKALTAMWVGNDQAEAARLANLDRHKLHRLNSRLTAGYDVRDWIV